MGVGETGKIIGETGVGETGVGEMGVIHKFVFTSLIIYKDTYKAKREKS